MTTLDPVDLARRRVIAAGGALGLASLGLSWATIAAAAEHAHAASAAPDKTFAFLGPEEARDVAAIAAQVVPSGATPGATEAGVVYFIDYIFRHGFESQAGEFRAGLHAFSTAFAEGRPAGMRFADADPGTQAEFLRSVEATPFFGTMRLLTVLGLLSNPSYGGNRDKLGWKLVGFDDRHVWDPPFGHYDREYAGFVPYSPASTSSPDKSSGSGS